MTDGARGRPIVVEENEHQVQRAEWRNWTDPVTQTHQRPHHPEHSQAPEHPYAASTAPSMPPPILSRERYAQQTPAPVPQTSHQPRVYNHSPSSMSHVLNHSPSGTVEPPPLHPASSHSGLPSAHHTPSSSVQPVPPPPYYPPQPARRERSEKDKMLAGEDFLAFHPSLLAERDHCSNLVFRFNMTSKDNVQITHKERSRHFQAIVEAKWNIDLHYRASGSSAIPYVAGHVGQDVHVSTPFHCDYGYNLVIGDFVSIGPGCKFLDSGRITIGRTARIGAGVIIDTQKVPTDSKSRKGVQGTCVAREVVIGENVYVGAGAVICAGVKIGTGAIVQPGAVVMKVRSAFRGCVGAYE
ncbi:trimeric LpxA-like protein [Westerdykella ornata]|uniref:Trimeric LpxA-like protein n=1 Tax=Westerdykella ornata TaxID=318751 RepID=A0A6A6J420_WESOR|nr:trimeric LpxA-like protein [Westerdykella ornata]KAF2271321.1 trimeric LpxA-like protein [Westerdykella ornata]